MSWKYKGIKVWLGMLFCVIALVPLIYQRHAIAERQSPITSPEFVNQTLQELFTETGWLGSGLTPPKVVFVPQEELFKLNQRRHGGVYDARAKTISISNSCMVPTAPPEDCRAVLYHELVHWFQKSHTNWPGTPTEWELEAQALTKKYMLKRFRGQSSEGFIENYVWITPGPKPTPEILISSLSLVPAELLPYAKLGGVGTGYGQDRSGRSLQEGFFKTTEHSLLGTWLVPISTLVGDTRYILTITFLNNHPIALDLTVFTPSGEIVPIAWYWDQGCLPNLDKELPAKCSSTGVWVKVR